MMSQRHSRAMNWLHICAGAFLIAVAVVPPVSAQASTIKEAEKLTQQVIQLYGQGRYSEAISAAERALAIREQALGRTHSDTAKALNNLATLYSETGDYAKAEALLQRALAIIDEVLGPTHLTMAGALNNLAALYSDNGAYAKAEALLQRALAITEQEQGAKHLDTAIILNSLAGLYNITGAYDKAAPLHQRVLAIREQELGPTHPQVAASLNSLATLYSETGAYAKAEPLLERALVIREEALGSTHPATVTSLNNLAVHYSDTGAYQKATKLLRQGLAITEQVFGPTHQNTASSLNNLAMLYSNIGAYAKAEPLLERALAIREEVLEPTHPDMALMLNNLAAHYFDTGAYDKAAPLHQRALAIYEEALGPMHPDTVRALNNLAMLYFTTGAYTKAEPLFERALAIREKVLGSTHPDTASSLNNLAWLYSTTGAYTKAEPLLQRALAIREEVLGPTHSDMATSLNNLAMLYTNTRAYARAEPLFERALAIREKVLGPTHPDTAWSLANLAGFYFSTSAYAKAEPLLQRALAIREKVLGPTHPDTASSLNNLAWLYSHRGAYPNAEALFQRALAIREEVLGPTHPDTASSLNNLAVLYWTAGNIPKALPLLQEAQTIQEQNIAGFLLSSSEDRKQAYMQLFRRNTFANISLSLDLPGNQAATRGIAIVLQTKGRVLDAMSDSLSRLRRSMRAEDRKLFEQFTAVVRQRSTLRYQSLQDIQLGDYRTRLSELAAKQEELEIELATRSAEFRQQIAPVTLAAVQAALPHEAALLEWFRYVPFNPKRKDKPTTWGKPRYLAYVLRGASAPAVVDLGGAESIELLVQDFRKALSAPQHTYVKEVAKELSAKLIKPLQPHLGNAKQLLISPDGALNLVPFGALLDNTGHYLATKQDITYLTSARDLLRFDTTPLASSDVVVVANPDYGRSTNMFAQSASSIRLKRPVDLDRGGLVFTPLRGTAEEAKALTLLLKVKNVHLLTRTKATEAMLKQLHGPRILHIATHGFFLSDKEMVTATFKTVGFSQDSRLLPMGENPLLRSGLALAGANQRRSGENDDGILTAAEVAQMDLRGTQLVVLSACETGVGEVKNGEGVYGLRRALVLAGAQTQVASLWKVADDATKDLMVDYYQRLLSGEGRSAALRHAQQNMIDSKDRSHPYYWAAFVPIGSWKPLEQ